jgi:hypothetical protein
MLTELYIEALLADESKADQVWELWNAGVITDGLAAWGWWLATGTGEVGEPSRTYQHAPATRSWSRWQ